MAERSAKGGAETLGSLTTAQRVTLLLPPSALVPVPSCEDT